MASTLAAGLAQRIGDVSQVGDDVTGAFQNSDMLEEAIREFIYSY